MGASFQAMSFDITDRQEICKQWDAEVENSQYESGHCYSGEIGMLGFSDGIEWRDLSLSSRQAAEEYIESHQEKWEPAMAVSFVEDGKPGWVVGGSCPS
jgi:hypothetical protein